MAGPRARQPPSWAGTVVVVVAVLVIGWRAAVELRRATAPSAAPTAPPAGSSR